MVVAELLATRPAEEPSWVGAFEAGRTAAIMLGVMSGMLVAYSGDLPQISSLDNYTPSTITRVYGNNGRISITEGTGDAVELTAEKELRRGKPEDIAYEIDVARRGDHPATACDAAPPATSASISIGSHLPLFIER